MSSHHFVKEGQEPALVILEPCSFSLAAPLLEWSPLVIVRDSALESVQSWGIKIDVLFAQEEIDTLDLLKLYAPEGFYEALFGFLRERGQSAIHVLGSRALFDPLLEYVGAFSITLTDAGSHCVACSGSFIKWYPAGTMLRTHPFGIHADGDVEPITDWLHVRSPGMVKFTHERPFWIEEQSRAGD